MKRAQDLHPYTLIIMKLVGLMAAGYPFGKNDLTFEEWEDLGTMMDILENKKREKPIPVYMVTMK
ncbi:MAG: hypothetical protein WC905_01315 [Patescibacteria group bacterium]|jgi:hypothetical protein